MIMCHCGNGTGSFFGPASGTTSLPHQSVPFNRARVLAPEQAGEESRKP